MINVTVYRMDNQITAFELSGHAESGPYGFDLVCAAVSAVSFGAVNAVMELCEIDLEIDQDHEGGYLHVTIPKTLPKELGKDVQLLLEGMIISLETIEREYKRFIRIQHK